MMRELSIWPDAATLTAEAARRFTAAARSAIAARGRFTVALAGGSTPRALYRRLIDQPIAWEHVHVFWGDERCVPPDHADSNYRMAFDTLLSKVAIPADHIHRLRGELDPARAANAYEVELRAMLPTTGASFDLVLLGLGADAHTASLFPGTDAIHEQQRWVIGHFVQALNVSRLTLTPPVLNAAKHLVFLVVGADKAAAVRSVFHAAFNPDQYPAQIIAPRHGQLTWLLDRAAAANLEDHAS